MPVTGNRTQAMEVLFLAPLQVGHALENDLAALRVLHARCIDTAALYPHPKVLRPDPASCAPHRLPFSMELQK